MESVSDIPLPGECTPEQSIKNESQVADDDECIMEVGMEHEPIVITDTFVTQDLNTSSLEVEIGALMIASQDQIGIKIENSVAGQTLEEVMDEVNAELVKSSEPISHETNLKSTDEVIEQSDLEPISQMKSEVNVETSHTAQEVETVQFISQCEIATESTAFIEQNEPVEFLEQSEIIITEPIEYVDQTEVGAENSTLLEQTDVSLGATVSHLVEESEIGDGVTLIEQTEVCVEPTTQFIEQTDVCAENPTLVEQRETSVSNPTQIEICLEEPSTEQNDVSFEDPSSEVVDQSDISYEEQTTDLVEQSEDITAPIEVIFEQNDEDQLIPDEITPEIVIVREKCLPDNSANETIEVASTSTQNEMEITEMEPDSNLEPKQTEPIVTYEPSEADSIDSSQNEENPNVTLTFEEVKDGTEDSSSSAQVIVEEPEEKMAVESQEGEEEMTEVLVMETANQANAMEVGQLTENVTIEIIDTLKNNDHTDMNFKEYTIESNDKDKNKTENTETVYIIQEITETDPKPNVTETNKSITQDIKPDIKIGQSQLKTKSKSKIVLPTLGRPRRIVTRNSNQHPDLKGPLPCHLLGRNVDNPTEDSISNGRTPPKPRLGVKVPYRFLTSQIVSKEEITDELLELVAKRNPQPDPPMGGDIFFAQKLTQRLANKIAASESKRNKLATEKAESSKTEDSTAETSKIIPLTPELPPSTDVTVNPKSSTSKIHDNSDLLAILEGDDDDVDWTKELRSPKKTSDHNSDHSITAEQIVSVTVTKEKVRRDLDPEQERQLALKQLQEMPGEPHFGRSRRKQVFHHQDLYKPGTKSGHTKIVSKAEEQPGPSRVLRGDSSSDVKLVKEKKIETPIKKTQEIDVKTNEVETKPKKQDVKSKKDETAVASKTAKEVEEKIEDVEPTISPRKVMKTYSRKEIVLNVPPELEYIVSETDPSALTELEKEQSEPLKEDPKLETSKQTIKPETSKDILTPTTSKETPKPMSESPKEIKISSILTKIGDLKSAIDKKMESMKITMDLKLDYTTPATEKPPENPKAATDKKVTDTEPNKAEKKTKLNKATKIIQRDEPPKKLVATQKKQKRVAEPELMLVSKRARIIKKKVIWDPAEAPQVRTPVKKNVEEKLSKKNAKKEPVEKPKETVEPTPVNTNDDKVSNGQTESRQLRTKKIMPRGTLRRVRQAQTLLMKRQLRSISGTLVRSTNSELKKSLVMKKKKKAAIVEQIKKDKPKKTELDRLLMDEGAVNMLYSVRGKGLKRKAGVSRDRHQKELMNRTQMVKDVITQSSNQEDSPKALRKKDSPVAPIVFTSPPRKKSRDSIRSSIQSPPPSPSYMYPHRAEASRIIRRHSSSFSSDCSSTRRLSIDLPQTPNDPKPESQEREEELESETPEIQTRLRRKGVPIFERKLEEKTYKGKKKLLPDEMKEDVKEERLAEQPSQKLTPAEKRKLNAEMSKNFSKQPLKKRTRSSKGLEDEEEFKEEEKEEKPKTKTPIKVAKKVEPEKKVETEKKIEPEKNVEPEKKMELETKVEPQKKEPEKNEPEQKEPEQKEPEKKESEKKDTRQVSVATEYKEISLKRMDNLVQIILTPTSTNLKNTINLVMFTEMVDVLTHLSQDETCRVVLLTSTDSSFCHGVDFSTLIQTNTEKRLAVIQEMAKAVKNFLHCLASFPKPLVAGVQGSTVGLGVTMLPLFDLVFASDKATFSTPYGRLGQVPEGIAFLTLPHLLGNSLTSELLLASRKLTASEALHHGLVTRILWPDKFQEEVMSNSLAIANQSSQSMIATKRLLRKTLLAKLDDALELETNLLIEHWGSAECQQNFKKMVQEEEWW